MSPRNVARLALAAGLLLATGCVTSMTESELKQQLDKTADEMRIGKRRIVPIYAETKLVAQVMLVEARTDPKSQTSRHLGKRIAVAARRGQIVVAGGPYPALSDQLLRNALTLQDEGSLRGLRLVLVSSEGPSDELSQAARAAQARLYHRSVR